MKRQLLTSGLQLIMLRVGGAVLSFCITVLLSRVMGAEGFGVYSYALTVVALACVPMGSGWATLLLRVASEGHARDDWIGAKGIAKNVKFGALLISLIFLLLGSLVLFFTPIFLSQSLSVISILLLAIVLFFDQLSANRIALIRAIGKPQLAQIPDQLVRPALIFFGVLTAVYLLGEGYSVSVRLVFFVVAVAAFLNFCIGHVLVCRQSPKLLFVSTAQKFSMRWVKQALLISGAPGLIILNSYTDILVLGFFGDAADVGRYKVAVQIGVLSGLGYAALNFIAAQKFAALRSSEQKSELQEFATFCSRAAFVSVIPVPIILYFFGEPIVGHIFGEEFLYALPAMIVLCLLQLVSSGLGMCNTLLMMNGLERYIIALTAACLLLNIFLCMLLIPRYGITGAAVSNLLATGAWKLALWFISCKKLSVDTSIIGRNFGRPI